MDIVLGIVNYAFLWSTN